MVAAQQHRPTNAETKPAAQQHRPTEPETNGDEMKVETESKTETKPAAQQHRPTEAETKAPTIKSENRLVYDCFNIEVNGDEVVAFADNGRLVLAKKGECQIVPAGKGQRYAQLVCDRTKIVVQ